MNNRKNFKHLLFAAGIFFALFIFTSSFTACSSHILDIQEGLQSAPTPTPETTPPPEPTPTPTPAPTPTAYSITVTSGEHGAISVDKTNAAAGETITITVTPEADYMLDVLTITDSSGNAIAISAAKTFTMPESDVTVSGTFKFAILVMLSGPSIHSILYQNNVQSIVTKFIHSATPPETGIVTYKLSADNSDVDVLAWLDGTTIKFYAEGYTDSNRKIPLNANSREMFANCTNLTSIDCSAFDTSNVTNMCGMFFACNTTSLDLSSFNTSNVTDMSMMFYMCRNLTSLDLSNFNTTNVTDMHQMFDNCRNLTSLDLSNFNTTNVTDMNRMFYECSNLTSLDLSSFNTSNVTDMHDMFYECSNLASLNLSSFDTSNVTDMSRMFYKCSNLTSLDLSSFNTSNVTDIHQMFANCSKIETIFASSNFVTTAATTAYNIFLWCNSLIGGAGTTYDDTNIFSDKIYARIDEGPSNPGYFTRKQ